MNTNKNWDHLLPKSVRDSDLESMSYTSFLANGDIYLIYNDCEENLDKTKDTEINEFFINKTCTFKVLYSKFNKDGFVEKKNFPFREDAAMGISRGFKVLLGDGKSVITLFYGIEKDGKKVLPVKSILKISVD